ncbi:hypothetical protein [Clostridium luticellarii]|jgi:hypothetical protein|uniref:hypothetical protein n=1 Tax=Clostridium luticellarii TaxID=1691940 RepID=UPI002355C2C9|nr:hypothetical protein [Clostridium luticellarii]MCI1944806.1 hypothetical protein [Clostridium luticellarii]MCI1968301.1 hypothetical protein [Clostridium luticellarii]
MKSSYFYSQNRIDELEISCISLIEKELDVFFSSRMEPALAYSHMLSDNLALHGRKNFDEKVLSDCQIKGCVKGILAGIGMKIAENMGQLHLDDVSVESVEDHYDNHILKETISSARITQVTAGICEHIIDSGISFILNEICGISMVNELLKRNISGRKILDKNNLANQRRKHRELIYRQIEGLMMNMKISLRNKLIETCIASINSIENTYDACDLRLISN